MIAPTALFAIKEEAELACVEDAADAEEDVALVVEGEVAVGLAVAPKTVVEPLARVKERLSVVVTTPDFALALAVAH